MKIIFLFDQSDAEGNIVSADSVPFVITPDKLNLRQIEPGVTALGVIFEQKNEAGEVQQFFRQIINFPIDLKKPEPPPLMAAAVPPVLLPPALVATEAQAAVKEAQAVVNPPVPVDGTVESTVKTKRARKS